MLEPFVIDDNNFKSEVLESQLPVLIDFWAIWCGPCRQVSPIVDKLCNDYEGRAKLCKVDVDNAPNVAAEYGIRSIPTLVFVKNGDEVNRIVGAVPEADIKKAIDAML